MHLRLPFSKTLLKNHKSTVITAFSIVSALGIGTLLGVGIAANVKKPSQDKDSDSKPEPTSPPPPAPPPPPPPAEAPKKLVPAKDQGPPGPFPIGSTVMKGPADLDNIPEDMQGEVTNHLNEGSWMRVRWSSGTTTHPVRGQVVLCEDQSPVAAPHNL